MYFQASIAAAYLVLGLFPTVVTAQSSTYGANLTLRFFRESQLGQCGYSNSSEALTFTTESVPLQGLGHCFNLADIFQGTSQGFINQTANLGYGSGYTGEPGQAGIHWQVENMDKFDVQANYSSVLYHQYNPDVNDKENAPGSYAARTVFLYPGQGCKEFPDQSNELLPWYGLSCWTEPEGTCHTLPYKIASFSIQAEDDKVGNMASVGYLQRWVVRQDCTSVSMPFCLSSLVHLQQYGLLFKHCSTRQHCSEP